MDKQQEYVLRAIEERDISFIRLWFTDVSGQLKSVAIAPAEVESAFTVSGMKRATKASARIQIVP